MPSVDKSRKIVEAHLKSIRKKHGKKVASSIQKIIFRCSHAESSVEQLGGVIMNERALAGHVGMYCMRKTKDKIIITRQKHTQLPKNK
jgi:hypothetical protein